jgi:hypothetical protein
MISFVLKLLEVIRLGEKERDIAEYGRESFSLIFENDRKDIYLKQGTYTVEHAVLGTMMLFLVPRGPGKNGMQYEVIVA